MYRDARWTVALPARLSGMELLGSILALAFVGLIVGALGRLALPGPNPMSIGLTILIGIGGALAGALLAAALGVTGGLVLLFEVLAAALIVFLVEKYGRNR